MTLRHALVTAALGPLLLAQGRRVRKTVPSLPEPPGEREGIAGSGPSVRLLIIGDSAAAGVGAPTQQQALSGQIVAALAPRFRLHWRLFAFTGATTADMLERLGTEGRAGYDVALTSLGVNDVTGRVSLGTWRRQQHELITGLRERFDVGRILLSGLPPVHRFPALPQPLRWYLGRRAREFDRALEAIAAGRRDCEFLALDHEMMDTSAMAGDGFHPGPPVYAAWAHEAARRITDYKKENP